MKNSKERFLIVGIILAGLMAVGIVGFQIVADRNRGVAVSKLRGPSPVDRYREKMASRQRDNLEKPVQNAPAAPQEQPKERPAPGDSITGFANAFSKAEEMKRQQQWLDSNDLFAKMSVKEWDAEDWARMKALMADAGDLIREIRRLAETGGPAYELDFSKGYAMELPHLAKLRDFERLLRNDALVQAHDGNIAEAVKDIVAGMKLSNVVKDEPILISQLVRCAMDSIAWQTLQDCLPRDGVDGGLLQEIIDYAGEYDARQSFADSLTCEGITGLDMFDRIRTGNGMEAFSGASSWERIGLELYGSTLARPLLNWDEAIYAETISRVAEAARLPYYEAKPIMDGIAGDIEGISRVHVMSRQLLPALTRCIEAEARNEAQMNLLQIGLSLERFHTQTGVYPATLGAISCGFGGTVPLDPFTGKPLIYRVSGDSFTLYSLGTNGIDDGGRYDYKTGDIVWRSEPEPPEKAKQDSRQET